jgi:hypothetical protein
MGALYNLAVWDNWKHDNAHTGKIAAAVWWDIWQNITVGACGLVTGGDNDVQFRQNGCKLEFSIDCVHWQTLYDPTDCIQAMQQPSGGGALEPGECREYDVSLPANGVWFLPFPVSTGYTLEISTARGAWAPVLDVGPVPVPWYCPNGSSYLVGQCVGSGAPNANGADTSLNFMTVLSRIDRATPIWTDMFAGIQTVPAGVDLDPLWFQANSNDLATGQGTVGFHLKVCAPASTYEHIFDFTTGAHGWTSNFGATWVSGLGWAATDATQTDEIWLNSPEVTAAKVNQVEVFLTTAQGNNGGFAVHENQANYTPSVIAPASIDETLPFSEAPDVPHLLVGIANFGAVGPQYTGYLWKIIVRGNGSDPWV